MKQGSLFLVLLWMTFVACPVDADVVESFVVGDPFGAGVGVISGPETATNNLFDTSPFQTGVVEIVNARSILAGGGNAVFTALADGTTELEFDMGVGLQLTTLDATLSYSEIKMTGIDSDAGTFTFEFSTRRLDGSVILDLSDITITPSSGSIGFTNLDVGLFQGELTGSSGLTEILFTGANANMLRTVEFKSITPVFAANELTVLGSRTLVTSVPEPGTIGLLGGLGCLALFRRRRIGN